MIVQHQPPLHLAYCLNIHPGESWAEKLAVIRDKTARVREFVAPGQWFGLGLRLSAQATKELAADSGLRHAALDAFAEHQFYPFSVNAFPYGRFHAGSVKEDVYAPDWRRLERRDYTFAVADVLAGWLPEGVDGSISTVPGSFKGWIEDEADVAAMATNLGAVAAYLAALREDTGREIHLGLEPEPSCYLETTAETVSFFKDMLWTTGVEEVKRIRRCYTNEAEELMRRHLGVCFDTCHVALQFEDPLEALRTYRREGIRISKVQLSAALMTGGAPADWSALRPFAEGVYLHQVKSRLVDGNIRSWIDLPLALADDEGREGIQETRVHFHVPLFFKGNGPLASTVSTLSPDFFRELRARATSHVEIETYTFDVLPPEMHAGDVVNSISREYAWVQDHL
jgi:sugar phosphate isomerase/epimerase